MSGLNFSKNKKPFIAIAVMIAVIVLIFGASQVKCQETVTVTRDFVEDANKAFDLVVEQRATIAKFLEERAKTDVERIAAQQLKAEMDKLIAVKDQISDTKDRLLAVYERIIALQNTLIDQLEKKLLKPKSFFQKFLQGLKETAILIAGVALGRAF